MNVLLSNVTKTKKDGEQSTLEQIYIRGSQIRLLSLPEQLAHSRYFRSAPAVAAKPQKAPVKRQRQA